MDDAIGELVEMHPEKPQIIRAVLDLLSGITDERVANVDQSDIAEALSVRLVEDDT